MTAVKDSDVAGAGMNVSVSDSATSVYYCYATAVNLVPTDLVHRPELQDTFGNANISAQLCVLAQSNKATTPRTKQPKM